MTDFDFVTMVFLIPGAVGALVIQNIAMRSDYEAELARRKRPIVFNTQWLVAEPPRRRWWFW
jgi:hypothetical protein